MRAAVLAVVLAGCSLYDPNLGDRPFLCGTDEPRCPDGYTPVDVTLQGSAPRCECQRHAIVPDAGAEYLCNSDKSEPNDTVQTATEVIAGLSNLAICPVDDVDVFKVTVLPDMGLLHATVSFDPARSPPTVDIVDGQGVSLAPTVDSHQAGTIDATAKTPRPGSYFVRVSGKQTVNYSLRVEIIPPS